MIDVTAEGKAALAHALALIWPSAAGGKAVHYRDVIVARRVTYYAHEPVDNERFPANVNTHLGKPPQIHISHNSDEVVVTTGPEAGTRTLILLWHADGPSLALPFQLKLDAAVEFVHSWLESIDYPPEPDHDGSNHKGFRAFTDSWGHVAGHRYGIVGIQPAWAMYGK